jgi:signal transduction histidine kinase
MTEVRTARQRDFWERTTVGWHVAHYAVVAVVTVAVLGDDALGSSERRVALGLLAVVAAAYAVAGRPALGTGRPALALAYLVPAWAAFLGLASLLGGGFLLLFVLFPQSWAMLSKRAAVAANAVGMMSLVVVLLVQGDDLGDALVTGAVNLAISLLLGLWITGILEESHRRAELIAELERARDDLAAAEHARGVLAERERLAHEIHDTLAQGFTSILALAQAIEVSLDRSPDRVREQLALLERTARENLAEARALVAALGPVDLHEAPLAEAVRRVATRFGEEVGVRAEVDVVGEPRALPSNSEVVLLRATQEALANVRRHAGADRVSVRLSYDEPTGAALEVRDDGRGFDPLDVDGYGLRGMRARVEQVGGDLDVDTGLGRGTTIRVRIP